MGVRVLLCGMGGYGENYVREYLTRDVLGSSLAAIADPFAERSPMYADVVKKGIPVFKSPDDFYMKNEAELCVISSPIHTHFPYVMTALEHGSNVLTEKPVCFRPEQFDAMMQKSKETGLFVAVGYQQCFSGDVLALKRDILDGVYGKAVRMKTIRLMRRNDIYYGRSSWAGALKCAGEPVFDSPFTNACAHQFQTMVFLLGKTMDESVGVKECSGSLVRVRPGITNCDTVQLRFVTDDGVELYVPRLVESVAAIVPGRVPRKPCAASGIISGPECSVAAHVVIVKTHHLLGQCIVLGLECVRWINTLHLGKVDYV